MNSKVIAPPTPTTPLTAQEILIQAERIVNGEREDKYGHPLVNFLRIALRWSNYLGVKITPADVALMMVDTKMTRQQQQNQQDNIIDGIGYYLCHARIDDRMRELGFDDGVDTFKYMPLADMQLLYTRLTQTVEKIENNG